MTNSSSTEKTTLDVLRDARALVEKGWLKGENYRKIDDVDCYCTIGALWQAAVGSPAGWTSSRPYRDAFEAMADAVGDDALASWNDRPDQTCAGVLAGFDVAIAKVSQS